jgi:hypothetical protein
MATNGLRRFLRKSDHTEHPEGSSQGSMSQAEGALPASVLRAPAGFACGLCGSQFVSLAHAKGCLESCVVRQRLREPLQVLASPSGSHYRCSLCSRVRVYRDDALRCFEGCLERLRHTRSLPHPLVDALDGLRPGAASGPLAPACVSSLPRGPLFRGSAGALEGNPNRGLRGLPLAHAGSVASPLSSKSMESHLEESVATPAQGKQWETQTSSSSRKPLSKPLSAEEMARKTQELLLGDVPEGTLVQEAEPFVDGDEGRDESSQEAFREGATVNVLGEDRPSEAPPHVQDVSPEEAPAPEVPSEDAPAKPMKDAQGIIIYREPGMKPFKRADARYVCTACQTKYFTKHEVETCFSDHPLRPGSDMA